jgi:CBS domain containing-hemolysin-like protein
MGPNTLLVNARMTLDDLQEIVSLGLPEDDERDYDTLGGFLYSRVGDIPEEKTEIFHNDVTYFIDKVVGNRIKRVKIKIPQYILDDMTVDENSESE